MPNQPVPNAADVLPKGLLRKLQRYCSGSIYIPAPQTKARMHMARVRSLHTRGYKPADIARIVSMSAKQVRDIVSRLEDGDALVTAAECKVYQTVPQEIVETVQKYVSGRIYVPPRKSEAARRRSTVARFLRKGVPVTQIAKRSGLSERRVWQIKKAESELAQSGSTTDETQANKQKSQDPFKVGPVREPGYVPPRRCSICGIPVRCGEEQCDVCRYKAEGKRNADGDDIIVITKIPFAVIDRKF